MPRYVILQHDHPELHWDLMLQAGDKLRTWRLAKAPIKPGEAIEATAIGDHRLMYLDYEGPISGGRGRVVRWDQGNYEEEISGIIGSDQRVVIGLVGKRVIGKAVLERVIGTQWSFQLKET